MSNGVSIIIVTWNSQDVIDDCLSGLAVNGRNDIEIIILDNGSTDDTLDIISSYRSARLIKTGGNVGFAPACNEGIRQAKFDFILLLNPDARMDAAGVLALRQCLEIDPTVGAVAPVVKKSDGTYDPFKARNFPDLFSAVLRHSGIGVLFPRLVREIPLPDTPKVRTEVPYVCGCAVMVPRAVFKRVGYLDETVPMYYEDLEFCARLNKSGLKVVVTPLAEASHIGGSSSSKSLRRPLLYTMEDGVAPWLFYKQYKGRVYAGLFRFLIAIFSALRVLGLGLISKVSPRQGATLLEQKAKARALLKWSISSHANTVSKIKEHFDSSEKFATQPLISVLIHNKNRRDKLDICLRSVAACTYRPLEVVILDAHSTDGSVDLIKDWTTRLTRSGLSVVFRDCDDAGVPVSRNIAARFASGDILLFIDNDAEFTTPSALSQLSKLFEGQPDLGIISFRVLLRDSNEIDPFNWVYRRNARQWNNRPFEAVCFSGAACAIRAEVYRKFGGFWEALSYSREEEELSIACIAGGWRIRYEPAPAFRHWPSHRDSSGVARRRAMELENGLLVLWRRFPVPIAMAMMTVRWLTMSWRALRMEHCFRPLVGATASAVTRIAGGSFERKPIGWWNSIRYWLRHIPDRSRSGYECKVLQE